MRAVLLALGCVLAGPLRAEEPKLPVLNLTYAVSWKGISLGDATVTLKPEGGPDCYHYSSLTEPIGLVRMFYGKPQETSDFCVSDGRVVPRRYAFSNPGNEGSAYTLEFDSKAGKVRDGKGGTRDIPANAQDRLGIQQAMRLWVLAHLQAQPGAETVDFSQIDDTNIRTYRFAITGREDIRTPAGLYKTVLVQRIDNPDITSKFWLAPEHDYMPVRFEQVRGGNVTRFVLRKP